MKHTFEIWVESVWRYKLFYTSIEYSRRTFVPWLASLLVLNATTLPRVAENNF